MVSRVGIRHSINILIVYVNRYMSRTQTITELHIFYLIHEIIQIFNMFGSV